MKRIPLVLAVLCALVLALGSAAAQAPAAVRSDAPYSFQRLANGESKESPMTHADSVAEELVIDSDDIATVQAPGPVLSNDPYSFQMIVNGEVYAFPMTYADFTAKGWVLDADDAVLVPSSYSTERFTMRKLSITAYLINFDINALPYSQCYVGGVSVDQYDVSRVKDFALTLPGGLEYATATIEDARALYGTPSRSSEGESYVSAEYEYSSYCELKLTSYNEEGVIDNVMMRCFQPPQDFSPSAVSDEIPAIVAAYAAPAAISDDLADFTASYGGVLYQLPVPVSALLQNGWQIVKYDSETTVKGRDSGWVTLIMDNQRLRSLATNYSPNATAITNCFVTKFESGDGCKIELIAANGLTVGMSETELLAALEGEDFDKREGSSYVSYTVAPAKGPTDTYVAHVRDGAVYQLEISHSPYYSDYTRGR